MAPAVDTRREEFAMTLPGVVVGNHMEEETAWFVTE
jgi:hypothetical protein